VSSERPALAQRVTRRDALFWAAALYAAWTATWSVYRYAETTWPHPVQEYTTWLWLGAKLCVWYAPVHWLISRRKRRPAHFLGLDHARGLGRGIVITFVFLLGVALIDALIPGRWPSPPILRAADLPSALMIMLISPALEEVLFRGYALQTLIEAGIPFWRANIEAALLFALLHVPGWLFQGRAASECAALGVNVALLGFIFGAVRTGGRTLWSSIFMHIANNAWHAGVLVLVIRGRGDA